MFKYDNVIRVEVELTTICQAACPQCPRNMYGGKVIDDLPIQSWTIDQFMTVFTADVLNHIKMIYFCGTYGDPLACKDLVSICEYAKQVAPDIRIGLHTNGGLGSTDVFVKLANCTDIIAFGIDGLEDTNHVYRRNVQWHKVIENAKSFIDAGGHAEWDFIVFEHNQHQVEMAKKISEQLGFDKFNIKKTSRFFNKQHEIVDQVDVQNTQGEYEYSIRPPTDQKYLNNATIKWQDTDIKSYLKNTCITCHSLNNRWIYVDHAGNVFPCGWTSDRMYGYEAKQTGDYNRIRTLMNQAGTEYVNVNHNSLQNIVNGPWFQILHDSWTNENRLQRCAAMCGDKINAISEQNEQIDYQI